MRHLFWVVIYLFMAAFAVYFGLVPGTFHPGPLGRNATGKPLPNWFGRSWFFIFAAVMLYLAIKQLR